MSEAISLECMKGVCAIFDDEVKDSSSKAAAIAGHLDSLGFPCLRYEQPPTKVHSLDSLASCSFFFLDWKFGSENSSLGGSQGLLDAAIVESIKALHAVKHAPIFVFTQDDSESLKERVEALDPAAAQHAIFCRKDDVSPESSEAIADRLASWLNDQLGAHVFFVWQSQLRSAINSLSRKLLASDKNWPALLAVAHHEDKVPPESAISEMLGTVVMNRVGALDLSLGLEAKLGRQ